ncbi:hypothetical protein OGAPHI_005256 [Ogataea philodendri]|uniref:Uncharacterized protein n=1 Tax=Ogataea philodendri TaxID=1378263 RepID=A0A9P8P1K8_9ASCO|nr:uncharacterized protein OGAPHI_005256 [Ogataea philodendri]KAH3663853.1 hypothetical protein OGAPHI_005256 [Ogataea philodendri]
MVAGEIVVISLDQLTSTVEDVLIRVINRGYNKPRFRYGVIDTPRIKNSVLRDLSILEVENSYLALFLAPKTELTVVEDQDAQSLTRMFVNEWDSLEFDGTYSDQLDSDGLEARIVGTVGVKKTGSEYELTALTSFYPKLSTTLLDFMHGFCKRLGAPKTVVDVIYEHELVDFYEKHGYCTTKRTRCEIDPQTGYVKGTRLEDGIRATRNFVLVEMERQL